MTTWNAHQRIEFYDVKNLYVSSYGYCVHSNKPISRREILYSPIIKQK